ncbi:MAG: glycerophosphoryl diester phosphodiesterase membrane domain-containing protein [Rhizomicrobium sp.]
MAEAAMAPVTGLLIFLAILWFIYAAVRVIFFIPAVVVAENHIGIRRSWHLGRGNFWRILGIFLIVTVPLSMAVNTIAQSILQLGLGPEFGSGMMADDPAELQKLIADVLHAFGRLWPYYAALQLLSFVLQAGLTVGASANAYKLVTGADDAPPAKVAA